LRERPDDIALLVEYFVDQYARKAGKRISNIQKRTLDRFLAYPWPGNVRELQNIVERAVLLCDGETLSVDESWLRQVEREESSQVSIALGVLRRPEASHERELIEAALTESAGRISGPWGAAAKLGIPRQTLESKMARLGIARPRPRTS
jgi:DNA-binding NtrC family response regulator